MSNALSGKRPLAVLNESSVQSAVKHQSASNGNVFNNCTFQFNKNFHTDNKKRRKMCIYSDSESSQSQ